MSQITVYATNWCPYSIQAKKLLKSLGVTWKDVNIELEGISRVALSKLTGGFTIPQVVINGKPVGGYSELSALHQRGELLPLINNSQNIPAEIS